MPVDCICKGKGLQSMVMNCSSKLPWMKINDFLLDSERIREPREFCVQVIKKIYSLIPYDQARIYFVNDNGKVNDAVLIGVEQRWSDIYLEYYSKIEQGHYSICTKMENERFTTSKFICNVYDWTNSEIDEFVNDYIKPQGLKYSLGFGLHNANNFLKVACSFDRTNYGRFTQEDMDIMSIILPHLKNLYQNLYTYTTQNSFYINNPQIHLTLTKREAEIAELLCSGMTPNNISKKLFLSLPTTYKHIANIHAKLNVSNRQELILKLINCPIEQMQR